MSLDLPAAGRYVVTAKLGPLMMLSIGEAKIVGNRSSASMQMIGKESLTLPIEDSVNGDAIVGNAPDIASEIIARVQAGVSR